MLSRNWSADYGVSLGVVSAAGDSDGVALLESAAWTGDSDMVAGVWSDDVGDAVAGVEGGALGK